jgi:TRAP-type C4-dicarboxylate transport system permease small subunit
MLFWVWRHLEEVLGSVCFTIVVATVSVNVFLRYVVGNDLHAASEIATTMYLWAVMFGIGAVARRRLHPAIDLLPRLLPGRIGVGLTLVVEALAVYILADLTVSAWHFAWESGFNKYTVALRLPYVYTYLALPVGLGLMLVRVVENLIADLRAMRRGDKEGTGETPEPVAYGEGVL